MQQQSISAVVTHGDVKQSQLADSKSASPASLPDYHYFKLISQDKTTFPIERDNLRISKFFTDLFVENPKVSEFKMDSPSHVVGYLVEYLNQHKGKPGSGINVQKPIRSQNLCDSGISEWDNDFAKRLWNLSNESFMDLLHVALNYNIPCLKNLGCAYISSILKGQPAENFQDILKLRPLPK